MSILSNLMQIEHELNNELSQREKLLKKNNIKKSQNHHLIWFRTILPVES